MALTKIEIETYEKELLQGEVLESLGALMKEQELTYDDIDERTGIPSRTVRNLMEGGSTTSLFDIARIALALGYRCNFIPVKIGGESPGWCGNLANKVGEEASRPEGASAYEDRLKERSAAAD